MATSKVLKMTPMHAVRALGGIMERAAFALKAGVTFKGKRDLYEALGYARKLEPLDYRARYDRGGMASRVVEAFPHATWRGGGELIEDEDPEFDTEFETAWEELNKRLNAWAMLQRTDILAGLGQYAVLLIGAPGDPETPMGQFSSPDDVLYLAPYAQDEAKIVEIEQDTADERFGLPVLYRIRRRIINPLGGRIAPTFDKTVHWSRVIHVADLSLDDRVFGRSRMERVWNYLDDLDKVVGGGSEAFWQRVHQGYFFSFDPEAKLDPAAIDKIKEESELFAMGMKRTMGLRGAKAEVFGSDVSNFGNQVTSIISLISGATGIPQRILLGSERGELASTQDKENWNDRVQDRRDDYAEPQVIRPFVERLIEHGALPEPKEWKPRWPEIDELNETEKAAVAVQWSTLNGTAKGVVVLPEEIRDRVLGLDPLTPKQIADATPPPPTIVAPAIDPETGKPIPPTPGTLPPKETQFKKGTKPPDSSAQGAGQAPPIAAQGFRATRAALPKG